MQPNLSQFLAEVVLTSHYLAEPPSKQVSELSDAEMRCLRIISMFEPLSMQEIAQKLGATKPRATQLVALLEANAMVKREIASDRRRINVTTSKSGKEAITTLQDRYAKLAKAIEAKLGPSDTQKLCEILEQITPLNNLVS